jgi:hypothetical protein
MHLKSIAAALGIAALTTFATAPANANTNAANDATAAALDAAAQLDATPTAYRCGCGYRYVRYYPVRYYRVRYVRYYYY